MQHVARPSQKGSGLADHVVNANFFCLFNSRTVIFEINNRCTYASMAPPHMHRNASITTVMCRDWQVYQPTEELNGKLYNLSGRVCAVVAPSASGDVALMSITMSEGCVCPPRSAAVGTCKSIRCEGARLFVSNFTARSTNVGRPCARGWGGTTGTRNIRWSFVNSAFFTLLVSGNIAAPMYAFFGGHHSDATPPDEGPFPSAGSPTA